MCIWGVRSVHSKGRSGGWGWVGRGSGKSGNAHHGLQPSWWSLTCVILVYFSMETQELVMNFIHFHQIFYSFPISFCIGVTKSSIKNWWLHHFSSFFHNSSAGDVICWGAGGGGGLPWAHLLHLLWGRAQRSVHDLWTQGATTRPEGTTGNGGGGCGWLSFETIMDDSDELMMIMCSRWKVKSHQNQSLCSKFWNIDW